MNEATDRLDCTPLPYYVAHLDRGHERVLVVPVASENVHADRLFLPALRVSSPRDAPRGERGRVVSGEQTRSRYAERLDALEALSARLTVAGMPHAVRRYVPNGAPTTECDRWSPQLEVGKLAWVRAVYDRPPLAEASRLVFVLSGQPKARWATDDGGVDQLASALTAAWLDHRARRGERDERRM